MKTDGWQVEHTNTGAYKHCRYWFQLGIGLATTIIVFFVNCYYNVILCWAFYYMFASLTNKLPWDSCDNYWNTENCTLVFNLYNSTDNGTKVDPTTEFWEYEHFIFFKQ